MWRLVVVVRGGGERKSWKRLREKEKMLGPPNPS